MDGPTAEVLYKELHRVPESFLPRSGELFTAVATRSFRVIGFCSKMLAYKAVNFVGEEVIFSSFTDRLLFMLDIFVGMLNA